MTGAACVQRGGGEIERRGFGEAQARLEAKGRQGGDPGPVVTGCDGGALLRIANDSTCNIDL